ncbi:MAG: nitronate monooxygenase [Acidimicrobiia bacterium]
MLHTRFTDLVGCDAPIQLAPMGAISSSDLLRAVVDAGGMGMCSLPMAPADAVAQLLDALLEVTPIGFNVLVPFLDLDVIDAAASRCRLVDFYHGPVDAAVVARVHDGGAFAGWQTGDVDEARAAADAGCDVLVVRGTEGGGRMYGGRGLWPLLAEVLDAVDVPVLAAGGIASGRLLAAALAAGADGVRLGTRFVATLESGAHDAYKQALVTAPGDGTVLTEAYATMWPDTVRTARVLRRALAAAEATEQDPVGQMMMGPMQVDVPRFGVAPPPASATGDVDAMAMYAGESAGAVTSIEPAREVLRRIVHEAEDRLRASRAALRNE